MADLTARLLSENFEEALNTSSHYELREAIRELHARLRTAKADLDRKDRTIIALEELRRQTAYIHSERIKEKEILAYDTGKELEAALVALATAKAEGAAEAQRYKAAHELWTRAEADLAAAREEIARKDEAQGHLARLCSERLDKILELERQLVNEKTAHAWTEVREQAAIDAARAGGGR